MVAVDEFDPFEILQRHVRSLDLSVETERSDDDLLRLIMDGDIGSSVVVPINRPRRRRRRIIVGVAIGIAASGGVVAAAVLDSARPSHPQAGTLCHAAIDSPSGIVLPPGVDPVTGCEALWSSGSLPDIGEPATPVEHTVPRLIACIGTGGAVEVFPSADGSCGDLDLPEADRSPAAAAAALPLIELQERFATAINKPCLDVPEAKRLTRQMLDDSGHADWTITTDSAVGPCVKAALDFDKSLVNLVSIPDDQSSTNSTKDQP